MSRKVLATIADISNNRRKVIVSSENMTSTLQKAELETSLENPLVLTGQEEDLAKLDLEVKSLIDRSMIVHCCTIFLCCWDDEI